MNNLLLEYYDNNGAPMITNTTPISYPPHLNILIMMNYYSSTTIYLADHNIIQY